jgi:hypothetical protein
MVILLNKQRKCPRPILFLIASGQMKMLGSVSRPALWKQNPSRATHPGSLGDPDYCNVAELRKIAPSEIPDAASHAFTALTGQDAPPRQTAIT